MLFVTGLSIFHCILKCKGKTTREYLKNRETVVGKNISNDWFKNTPSFMNYSYQITEQQKIGLEKWKWDRGGIVIPDKKIADEKKSICSFGSGKISKSKS